MAVAVGLDIGSGAVRAAVIDTGKNSPVLRRFAEMPVAPGAVVAGEIVDAGAVTEAVTALWRRNKLPRKRVVIGLANQRVIVRQVDVPHLEESEMVEALPFQVQDAIPIPVEEAVLDYVPQEASEKKTPSGRSEWAVTLVRTPKVIEQIKTWAPRALLVGFKLEVGRRPERLREIAIQSLRKSRADFFVANDLTQIRDETHPAVIIDRSGHVLAEPQTKSEIARELCAILARSLAHA